jgi:hypothetical protein
VRFLLRRIWGLRRLDTRCFCPAGWDKQKKE